MRKNILYALGGFIPMCVMLFASCDNNIPDVKEVPLKSATLDISGMFPEDYPLMEVGQTVDISNKMTVVPADATDRAQTFFTTDPTVASVNGLGVITANSPGTVTITVYVGHGNVHDSFELEIVDVIPIYTTALTLSQSAVYVGLGGTTEFDVKTLIRLEPYNANDGQTFAFAPGDAGIASVSEDGMITGVSTGTATLTVASKSDPSINATLIVHILDFVGWYKRNAVEGASTTWTMTVSQDPLVAITDCGQGIASALDSDPSTNIAIVRPGKSTAGTSNPSGGNIWFIVDMKEAQVVNSFKIIHRVGSSVIQTRFWGFDEISGSNDGNSFSTIARDIRFPADVADINVLSSTVLFPNEIPYRYIKFYAETANCFYQNSFTSNGNAVQMQELYMGVHFE